MLPSSLKFSLILFVITVGIEWGFSANLTAFPFHIISFDSLFLICFTTLFYEIISSHKLLKIPGLLLLGSLFVVGISVDLTCRKYFKLPLAEVAGSLNYLGIGYKQLPGLYADYVNPRYIGISAGLVGIWILCSLSFFKKTKKNKKLILITSIYSIAYLSVSLIILNNAGEMLTHVEALFDKNKFTRLLLSERLGFIPLRKLSSKPHIASVVAQSPIYLPATIVIFINESTADQFVSVENDKILLKDSIVTQSHINVSNLVKFNEALTNSPCTDVSVPSLTTGAGPEEGYQKLHDLPFIWDLAKTRGYETAFIASTQFEFARFNNFFSPAKIDYLFSADSVHSPIINDIGIDDIITAKAAANYIAKNANKKLFLVVFNNALHTPFQVKSTIPIPPQLLSRHAKARYIFEEFYKIIFSSLQQSGRLADSLIIFTGDHGEDPLLQRKTARLISHYDEFLRVPFFIYFPDDFPKEVKKLALSNSNKLVSNLDIAPTLLDLFGLTLPYGYHYEGYSLLKPVPSKRLSISTSNTEWRKWPAIGFGLAREGERFICISGKPCAYYNTLTDPNEQVPVMAGSNFSRYSREAVSFPLLKKEILNVP